MTSHERTDGQLQILHLERLARTVLDQLASKGGHILHKVLGDVLEDLRQAPAV